MADEKLSDIELDALFEAARLAQPQPEGAWLARVAQDAAREAEAQARRAPPSLWRQVIGSLGGWQGLGGMAVACAAGLWIGMAPPAALGDPVALAFGASTSLEWVAESTFDAVAFLEEG